MATDTFFAAHGRQNYRRINVTHNRHLNGASAGFSISSSVSCSICQVNVLNDTCELGRTVFIETKSGQTNLTQFTIGFTGGGPLGVVTLDGMNWTFVNVALLENDPDSDWIVGFVHENRVLMVNCVISLSASDFDLRTERVVIDHNGTVFRVNGDHLPRVNNVQNDRGFVNLTVFNVTHPLHAKVDKFVQMRSDDIYREPEIALLDEAVVCLIFPLFVMVSFIWMRAIYAPRPDLGAFLRDVSNLNGG
jgi:hypothetical protein